MKRELIFFVRSDANARALQDLVITAGYDFSIAQSEDEGLRLSTKWRSRRSFW
jgi:hypothetical protein